MLFRSRRDSRVYLQRAAGGGRRHRGLDPQSLRHRQSSSPPTAVSPSTRFSGTQGEMLADDAREAIRGEPRPGRDPPEVLAELRALRDSGVISAAEFEIRKSAIWRDI